jgi:hypothetical protein
MDDFVSSGIKNILLNGINLNLESIEEEQNYIQKMQVYFEEETEFTAYLKKDDSLEVETEEMQLGMQIHIVNSTLYMVPYIQDVFEIFAEVLKFISSKHMEVVREFRGTEEIKIESPEDLYKVKNENTNEKETEEESSDDDDYEWI